MFTLIRIVSSLAISTCVFTKLGEVNISPSQWVSPKASAYRREDGTLESRPLEDMFPFLPRDEVWENMHMFDDENELNHEADPEAGT